MIRTCLAVGAAFCLLGACLPATTGEPSPVVGVEVQRGHARVLLADGRRCRAAFPADGMSEVEGQLEGCNQPWAYRMQPAPVHGQAFLSQLFANVAISLGSPLSPSRREPMIRMHLAITDDRGDLSRWDVHRGTAPGTAGVRLD